MHRCSGMTRPPRSAVRRSRRGFLFACASIAWQGAGSSISAAADEELLKPFAARYQVQWRGINVGTSELVLKPLATGDGFEFASHSNATGLFRLVYSEEILQASTFKIVGGHAQPLTYRGDDGTPKTDKDVHLSFDWGAMRISGTAENQAVALTLKPLTQDPMSVQAELILGLNANRLPSDIWLADKNEIKDYVYTDEGKAQLRTPIGDLSTRVLSSRRPNGNRITRLWFAPSLGNVPVKAERTRDGRIDFAMNIRTLRRP